MRFAEPESKDLVVQPVGVPTEKGISVPRRLIGPAWSDLNPLR